MSLSKSFCVFSAACGRGFYKSSSQDLQCSRCPLHSFNDHEGSWRCDCEDGYYRALSDPPAVACTSKCITLLLQGLCRFLKMKVSHVRKKIHSHRPVQWSHSCPTCVLWLFLPHPTCHDNYVCRPTCLGSVLAACY